MRNTNIVNMVEDFNNLFTNNKSDVLKVDVVEDENKYTVHADVPGIPKEEIKVNFNKGRLTIEIEERKIQEVKEGEKLVRSERFYSKKSRSFDLSDTVNEEQIEASYKDGVLTLLLPKKESMKTVKQIEIK